MTNLSLREKGGVYCGPTAVKLWWFHTDFLSLTIRTHDVLWPVASDNLLVEKETLWAREGHRRLSLRALEETTAISRVDNDLIV